MEVTMEAEDDVFFAELSKQISLLIMDEEDDTVVHCPSVSLQAFSRVIHPNAEPSFLYEQTCRRESKGTGVFIPRLSHTRRKNRQGGFTNSSNTKYQRQPADNSRRRLDPDHVSYNKNPKRVSGREG